MKAILIDWDGSDPVYRQIADALRGWVARGEVQADEVLPSVRTLGKQLGVNLNTVAKAYRLLADEGLVILRKGTPARFARGAPPSGAVSVSASGAESPTVSWTSQAEDERAVHRLLDAWVLAGAPPDEAERRMASILSAYFRRLETKTDV
ncbi:MAG: GntR family transcriptional regulator [Myxococcota bacterium]